MNVLLSILACSPFLGSEALVGFQMCRALSRRHAVHLVTSAGMEGPDGVRTETVPVRFDDPNDVNPAQLLRFELKQRKIIERLLRSERIDVVHRVTPSGYKASLLAPPSVPLVIGPVLGSEPAPESFQRVLRPRLRRSFSPAAISRRVQHGIARRVFERYSTLPQLLEQASVILAGTEVTRRRLPEALQHKCRVVTYAGVEHDVFTPPPGGRPDRTVRLLFVGRIVPYKGVELLLRSAAAARRRSRFDLLLVGGGDAAYREYCRNLSDELRLSETVTFVSHQRRADLVELYRSADIFCMPSVETYGLAILEAMSCGCVPLVSDINGPGEIVKEGTGIKVPLESPEQFVEEYAERIVELVGDAERRRVLGAGAREHVECRHDWKRLAERWLEVYEQLIEQGTASDERFRAAV